MVEQVAQESPKLLLAAQPGDQEIRLTQLDVKIRLSLENNQKYQLIFDSTGECEVFFKYQGHLVEINKLYLGLGLNRITKEEAIETVRKALVYAMRSGDRLVLQCGKYGIDFKTQFNDDVNFPTDLIFNFAEWRKEENYKKIVRKDEDKDLHGNKGSFQMSKDFDIIIVQDITDVTEDHDNRDEFKANIPHLGTSFDTFFVSRDGKKDEPVAATSTFNFNPPSTHYTSFVVRQNNPFDYTDIYNPHKPDRNQTVKMKPQQTESNPLSDSFSHPGQQTSFVRKVGDTNTYEHFIFNYLLGNNIKEASIQTVSSQFTLENFFSASPILGGGCGPCSTSQDTVLFLETEQKINEQNTSRKLSGDFGRFKESPNRGHSRVVEMSREHTSSGNSRSRERRSRLNRLSRDIMIPVSLTPVNGVRESIEEIMRQIQIKPSPTPQPQRVFPYNKSLVDLQYEQMAFMKESEIQCFKEKVATKKIQRMFRAYLFYKRIKMQRYEQSAERRRKIQLKKILAAKIIVKHVKIWLNSRKQMRNQSMVIQKVIYIQKAWRRLILKKRIAEFKRMKQLLHAAFLGWRTRRVVNALAREIQDYVNCDEPTEKQILKSIFLGLFNSVIQHKLWLSKNQQILQNLKQFQHRTLDKNPNQFPPLKIESSASKILKSNKHVKGAKSQCDDNVTPPRNQIQRNLNNSDIFGNDDSKYPRKDDLEKQNYTKQQSLAIPNNSNLVTMSTYQQAQMKNNDQITFQSTFETFSDPIIKGSCDVIRSRAVVQNKVETGKFTVRKHEKKLSQISTNIPSTMVVTPRVANLSSRAINQSTVKQIRKINESHLIIKELEQRDYSGSRQTLASTISQGKPTMESKESPKKKRVKGVCGSMDWVDTNKSAERGRPTPPPAKKIQYDQQILKTQPHRPQTAGNVMTKKVNSINYKKTLADIERLMDEVQQQQNNIQAQKNIGANIKISRPAVACDFDVSLVNQQLLIQKMVLKLKQQMNSLLNSIDPKFTFQ